jgi:hypothetical protein
MPIGLELSGLLREIPLTKAEETSSARKKDLKSSKA